MKLVLYVLLVLAFPLRTLAQPALLSSLGRINKEWSTQPDATLPAAANAIDPSQLTDKQLISLHLLNVENILRHRSVSHLSPAQAEKRLQLLDALQAYTASGAFPENTFTAHRAPVFIDASGNFCAVGHLLRASGNEQLSRNIAATNNLQYLAEMNFPEIPEWAQKNGFTPAELAWIQPTYAPATKFDTLGSGTNGQVYCMTEHNGNIYVAGEFTHVNGTASAKFAWLKPTGNNTFEWVATHRYGGAAMVGNIRAMISFNGHLIMGGDIAWTGARTLLGVCLWDTQTEDWEDFGQIMGQVNCFAVYNGELYAGGSIYSADPQYPFTGIAKWNGSRWVSPGFDVYGEIMSLHVFNNHLYMGGDIYLPASPNEKNILTYNGFTAIPVAGGVAGKVRTMITFEQALYIAGDFTFTATDTFALNFLDNNGWQYAFRMPYTTESLPNFPTDYIGAMVVKDDQLLLGGKFDMRPALAGASGQNFMGYYKGQLIGAGALDGSLNAFCKTSSHLFVGGNFTRNNTEYLGYIATIEIGNQHVSTGAPDANNALAVYPNPVMANATLYITTGNQQPLQSITIYNTLGVRIVQIDAHDQPTVSWNTLNLPEGYYFIRACSGSTVFTEKILLH